MKFLIDAQLPQKLAVLLNRLGYDTKHTLQLIDGNFTKDSIICELAKIEKRCVISKDKDFLNSHLINKEPPKLIIVKTGNISNNALLNIFEKNIALIVELLNQSNLIEIHLHEIIEHQ